MDESQLVNNSSYTEESKAQRDARLRRERRNAKLQADGSSRLSKISSMSGRPAAAEAEISRTPVSMRSKPSTPRNEPSSERVNDAPAEDPVEVDISKLFQQPQQDPSVNSQQEMFQRILRAGGENNRNGAWEPGPEDDPMIRMMQQMMAGMGSRDDQQPGAPGGDLPPGLANMFGDLQESHEEQTGGNNYLWRVIHTIFSLLIGIYAVTILSFTGSSLSRSEYITDVIRPRLFWMFATVELVLQTTRYFIDRGKLPPSSMMGRIAAFLPEPYAGYLKLLNRYSIIYTAVVSDALMVLFVLGAFAWWKGLADA